MNYDYFDSSRELTILEYEEYCKRLKGVLKRFPTYADYLQWYRQMIADQPYWSQQTKFQAWVSEMLFTQRPYARLTFGQKMQAGSNAIVIWTILGLLVVGAWKLFWYYLDFVFKAKHPFTEYPWSWGLLCAAFGIAGAFNFYLWLKEQMPAAWAKVQMARVWVNALVTRKEKKS